MEENQGLTSFQSVEQKITSLSGRKSHECEKGKKNAKGMNPVIWRHSDHSLTRCMQVDARKPSVNPIFLTEQVLDLMAEHPFLLFKSFCYSCPS